MKLQRFCGSLLALSIYSGVVQAGGFQLWEQDASGIGDYHAGAAAEASGPGTEYYNPAGMVALPSLAASIGLTYIPLDLQYDGTIRTNLLPQYARSYTNNYVPNFHLVYPFHSRLAFGFGITTPFGLSTNYPDDIPLSAAATKTELQTVNLNPNFAIEITKFISVGAGLDALYGHAVYNNALTFFHPPELLSNSLTDWGYGWDAGIMLYFTPHTRAGVSYRSKIILNGQGTSTFKDLVNRELSGNINLPDTTILGFYTDIGSRVALLFSAFYTQWSVFDNLILQNVLLLGMPTTISVKENYQNTWNLALGLHISILSNLMLKLGLGYDETPTQNGFRDLRLPDANRFAVALGLHWQVRPSFGIDAGWIHFFPRTAVVDNSLATADDPILIAFTTTGLVTANVNVIGIQLTWQQSPPPIVN